MDVRKRSLWGVPLFFWVMFIASISIVSVAAYTINQLPVIRMSLFEQTYEESYFSVTTLEIKIRKKLVDVSARITNNDVNQQSGEVTCVFYDAVGNVLDEITFAVVDLVGGGTVDHIFSSAIATQITYSNHVFYA